jgi:hypothetical protein
MDDTRVCNSCPPSGLFDQSVTVKKIVLSIAFSPDPAVFDEFRTRSVGILAALNENRGKGVTRIGSSEDRPAIFRPPRTVPGAQLPLPRLSAVAGYDCSQAPP